MPDLSSHEMERFRKSVRKTADCWIWTGQLNNQGYGRLLIRRDGRKVAVLAHRLAHYLATAMDPAPLVVRHRCDNRPCVNPDHLETGTQSENLHDALDRSRLDLRGLARYREARAAECVARVATGVKRCSPCGEVKPVEDFYRNRSTADGRASECAVCTRNRRLRNPLSAVQRARRIELQRQRRACAGDAA